MLETTLKTSFIPATNLSGELTYVDWRYLLPDLELDNVLCIGSPSVSFLSALSIICKKISIISVEEVQLQGYKASIKHDNENINIVSDCNFANLPFPENSVDLILLIGHKGIKRFLKDFNIIYEFNRILKPNRVLYFEIKGLVERYLSYKALKNIINLGSAFPQIFWLTPLTGVMHTAVPYKDDKISWYFFNNVMFGNSFKKQAISHVAKFLSRIGLFSLITPRQSVLIHHSKTNEKFVKPPEYLISIAKKAEVDLNTYRFCLAARGRNNSNKIIFYLFHGSDKLPEIIIKMTRSSEFNYRLENEYRVLSILKEKGFVDQESFPETRFFGYHHNLAVLAISAIHGKPFRKRTLATSNCPIAINAINWIVHLGIASANENLVSSIEVSSALKLLYKRFIEIYQVSSEERSFLDEQIASLAVSKKKFPLVFQHGDPGTWNIFVSENDNVIFLDWEAGEPKGMPLWDLFYFVRSYGSWVLRKRGKRDAIKNFTENFLIKSAISSQLLETTERYCLQVGLDENLVEPLFYTCWMHRALKESTRLPKSALERGHYVNLLRLCIKHRDAPALKALFSFDKII